MSSLFQIENDLLRLFDAIERADGEVSEEQYAELVATKENFKSKLTNYLHAIKAWEGDAATCKAEEARLKNVRTVRENRVKRLKNSMLEAVKMFGEDGKSGNKFVELPTCRIFTRDADSVNVNDERVKIFVEEFDRYIRELAGEGLISTGMDVDLSAIVDAINFICKGNYGPDFEPFTLLDATTMKLNISATWSIYDLFRLHPELLKYVGTTVINTELKDATSKTDWKTAIGISDKHEDVSKITVANIVTNTSLQIK